MNCPDRCDCERCRPELYVVPPAPSPTVTYEVHSTHGLEGVFPHREGAERYVAALREIGAGGLTVAEVRR